MTFIGFHYEIKTYGPAEYFSTRKFCAIWPLGLAQLFLAHFFPLTYSRTMNAFVNEMLKDAVNLPVCSPSPAVNGPLTRRFYARRFARLCVCVRSLALTLSCAKKASFNR